MSIDMKYLTILTLTVALVHCQNDENLNLGAIFGNATRDQFTNLVEVSSTTLGSLTALDKCGEGSDRGINMCVRYFQCDRDTNMIVLEGTSNGAGLIDIRFGANACDDYLDVCCGLPQNNTRGPDVIIPVTNQTTPSTPVDTPSSAPPIPQTTPVTVTQRPSSLFCGIRNENGIDFKITGNRNNEAEYGEFPWMVAILKTNFNASTDKTLALCGGSLIAPNVVLTGAHCVADLKTNQYKVRAGEWDTQTERERLPYQERNVAQAIIHESRDPQTLYNNVALLILSSPFDSADNIGTICLPNQQEVIRSANCFASGWGKDVFGKEGQYQVILKKIQLPIVQRQQCQTALRTTRLGPRFALHESFICAGGEEGKDTCTGDGGSPLVCPDPKNPDRYVQAGIVSWGIGCGEKGIPGVYANVAKFRSWIDNKLSRLNIDPSPYTV